MKNNILILILGVLFVSLALRSQIFSEQKRQPVIFDQPADSAEVVPENENITTNPTVQLPEITTIDQVFAAQSFPTTQKKDSQISLIATGDVLLARSINYKMVQLQDFSWPFVDIAPVLRQSDLTFINLETPLVTDCPAREDGMVFCGDTRGIESLQYAGIDVVNMANNHASNFGPEGVTETEEVLRDNKFLVSGVTGKNAAYTTVKGTTFAFLGYNEVNDQPGVTTAVTDVIMTEVAHATTQADIVVVQFHWGAEYTYQPTENQIRLAHLAIDSGADLIIGNHPHWYQPLEFYKNKLIVYSHGNLVFDQMWSRETREGIVGEYLFAEKKLVGVRFIPILIENYGQPRVLEGDEATKILDNFKKQSFSLQISSFDNTRLP